MFLKKKLLRTMKKLKKVSSKWKNLGRNFVLKGKGYYISYNPNPNASPDVALYGMMISSIFRGKIMKEKKKKHLAFGDDDDDDDGDDDFDEEEESFATLWD